MNSKDIYSFVDNKTTKQRRLDVKESLLKRSFLGNINYESVYKNGNANDKLDCWIYDDKSERKDGELKFIQAYPRQILNRGDYIHWNDGVWLVRGINEQYNITTIGMMYKCLDIRFRWIDEDGLHDIPFFAQSKVLRDPLLDSSALYLVDDSMEAYVQKNEETLKIVENMRFAFGLRTVFKVIEVVDYYIENIIKIILKKDEQLEQDDFVNHIAYNKVTADIKTSETVVSGTDEYIVFPSDDKVGMGSNTIFNITKFIGTVETPLTSSITCNKSGKFTFTVIDNNNFKIENMLESNLNIIVTITDLVNNKVIEKEIKLRAW